MNVTTPTTKLTQMAEAFANATPAIKTHIRRVTNFEGKLPSLGVYFSDAQLTGRRFALTVLANAFRLDEDTNVGCIVRDNHGSVHIQFAGNGIPAFENQTKINIAPTWEHGKLSYLIPVEFKERSTMPTPTPVRSPRKTTLHELLNQVRRIEKETDFRIERAEDGTLSFVARVK